MKKCTVGNRHKWEHVKNVELRTQTTRTVSISLKGLYKCACGAKKYGFMHKEKTMIENTQIDHELLEEFREELTPRLIGNCGHTPQLTDNMVKALYHVITDYLVRNSNDLPNGVMKSLREIS